MRQVFVLAIWVLGTAGLLSAGAAYSDPPSSPPDADERRDDDLSKRLIRKATTGTDADIMSQVTSLMSEAERRLVRDLDPGPQTQAAQEHVLQRLDDAIKMALQQRSTSRSRQVYKGERRALPEEPSDERDGKKGTGAEGGVDPGESVDAGSEPGSEQRRRGPFREARRGWGHLPQRDRDELLQGIEEEFIERYRSQIEQYYRALTESEEDQ